MTLQECLRDREKRQDAVGKGRVGVGVVLEGMGSEAMNRLRESIGSGMGMGVGTGVGMGVGVGGEGSMVFVLRVTEEGVNVER